MGLTSSFQSVPGVVYQRDTTPAKEIVLASSSQAAGDPLRYPDTTVLEVDTLREAKGSVTLKDGAEARGQGADGGTWQSPEVFSDVEDARPSRVESFLGSDMQEWAEEPKVQRVAKDIMSIVGYAFVAFWFIGLIALAICESFTPA